MRSQAEVASVLRIIRVELLKKMVFEQGPIPGETGSHRDLKIRDASKICDIQSATKIVTQSRLF